MNPNDFFYRHGHGVSRYESFHRWGMFCVHPGELKYKIRKKEDEVKAADKELKEPSHVFLKMSTLLPSPRMFLISRSMPRS